MIILYVSCIAIFVILFVATRKEEVFSTEKLSAVQTPFEKLAVFIYRKLLGFRRSRKMSILPPGGTTVSADLRKLNPSPGYERTVVEYYIGKIRYSLIFVFAASVLATLVYVSAYTGSVIKDGGILKRPDHGESSKEVVLEATDGNRESYGEYQITVTPRQYTKEESDNLAEKAFDELGKTIKGTNPDLMNVSHDLNLPKSLDGFPFSIKYESSRYGLIDSNGTVYSDELHEGEKTEVVITAKLALNSRKYERNYDLTVIPQVLSSDEKMHRSIGEALSEADSMTLESNEMMLPSKAGERSIFWRDSVNDSSLMIFVLVSIMGIVSFYAGDSDLHRRIEQRSRQLQLDYPQLISRLVLFAGAGMSIRSSFSKIAGDYEKEKMRGGKERYVYEEVLLVRHELASGIPEQDAYTHFGQRCGTLQYSKFCSLLTQNLRKGNSTLLSMLQAEAEAAFSQRKNIARQMGEEAGTKLLFPMILMLVVTMVIIIIPAYSSFAL